MFEIYQSSGNKKFYFRLKAANHQPILASQGYQTKAACKNGVKSVKTNSAKVGNFEKKTAKNGDSYFVLKSKNGEIIGKSQMYKSVSGRRRGILSVQATAPKAEVKEV